MFDKDSSGLLSTGELRDILTGGWSGVDVPPREGEDEADQGGGGGDGGRGGQVSHRQPGSR